MEQHFHVILFIMLYKAVITQFLSLWIKLYCVAIQAKVIEQYWYSVLSSARRCLHNSVNHRC